MKCPNCTQENPPTTTRCDCGYDFTSGRISVTAKPAPVSSGVQTGATRLEETRIVISDINMRFGSMVVFMVKWAFAAIPAFIVILGITFAGLVLLSLLGGSAALFQHKASSLSLAKPSPGSSPVAETKAPLELVSWDYSFHQGQYSQNYYAITLTLKNNAPKDIKLIDASVRFSDLLGNQVFGIKVSPDRLISAGESVNDNGEYSVNQFIAEQARMAQMKKEDIKATLIVRKLVFADNTVGEYSP